MRVLLAAWIVVGGALACSAAEIYVNNVTGNDRFSGLREETTEAVDGPVRSINRALEIVRAGDRIVIANTGTPYRESLSLSTGRHCGTAAGPFVIDGGGAILDGSKEVPPEQWVHVEDDIYRFSPPRKAHQQLFLDDRPLPRRTDAVASEALPDLEPLEWALHKGEIFLRTEMGRLPQTYNLRYADKQTGVTLYHVHNVVISDLIVQGFQLDGINANDGVRGLTLLRVTCRGNGRSGIAVVGTSRAVIEDSLVGDNGRAQLFTAQLAETYLHGEVELLSNTAPAIVREGGRVFRVRRE